VDGNKNDLKLLAVKIAEKIVGRALEMDPTLINDIVTQALRTTRQQKNVVIRCNEEDYDHLKENEKEFLDLMGQHGTIDIVVDPKIIRGGCIVDSELGVVDARLDVQLKKLQKVLTSK
jgi:type III secretion protein L